MSYFEKAIMFPFNTQKVSKSSLLHPINYL